MTKRSQHLLVIGGVCIAVGAGVSFAVSTDYYRELNDGPAPVIEAYSPSPYDWDTARAKLERIGAALQIYREHWGFLPAEKRKSYVDAGLPPSIELALRQKGKPWSIPPEDLSVKGNKGATSATSSFSPLYPGPYLDRLEHEFAIVWARRGERVPIMYDDNAYGPRDEAHLKGPMRILVLRLNGDVDEVMVDTEERSRLMLDK